MKVKEGTLIFKNGRIYSAYPIENGASQCEYVDVTDEIAKILKTSKKNEEESKMFEYDVVLRTRSRIDGLPITLIEKDDQPIENCRYIKDGNETIRIIRAIRNYMTDEVTSRIGLVTEKEIRNDKIYLY